MSEPARKPIMSMSIDELNVELAWWLEARKADGVVDIKTHVEVTNNTNPNDTKRAMINVFRQEADGKIESIPLRDIKSFEHLYAMMMGRDNLTA